MGVIGQKWSLHVFEGELSGGLVLGRAEGLLVESQVLCRIAAISFGCCGVAVTLRSCWRDWERLKMRYSDPQFRTNVGQGHKMGVQ